jgi:hypothetical protein
MIGAKLSRFPKKIGDEYIYEIGSSKPEDNFAYHFILRVFTTDSIGHCALQITINNNDKRQYANACTFSTS